MNLEFCNSEPEKQIFTSEFVFHGVPYSNGLVPHLNKNG